MEKLNDKLNEFNSYDEISELYDSREDSIDADDELALETDSDDSFYRSLEDY